MTNRIPLTETEAMLLYRNGLQVDTGGESSIDTSTVFNRRMETIRKDNNIAQSMLESIKENNP